MKKLISTCILTMSACGILSAQLANTTSLVGNVTDSAGAAMAGVSIVATNTGTQETYKATTNGQGDYTIQFLKVGQYSVAATQSGFETLVKNGITVNYNQTVRTDFTLRSAPCPKKS